MSFELENSPRTAGTRRLLIGLAAVTGLVCGAGGALAQGQRTRSAPATPPAAPAAPSSPFAAATPPPPPSALAPRLFTLSNAGGGSYIFNSNDNGRKIELRLENNEVVTATIDGEDVPKDRIVHEGNTILFKDENGDTVFEHTVSRPREVRIAAGVDASRWLTTRPSVAGTQNWRSYSGSIPAPDPAMLVEVEPPAVMLGLTMMEPDASLRGHLGLEPGTSTLVGAIYGGLPADTAGLEPYDIIIAVNGEKPADSETIRKVLREKNAGDEVKLTVIHRGKEREATIKLEKYDRDRFDENKVRSIAMVVDEDSLAMKEAMVLGNRYGQSLGGGLVGVAPDPNNPSAIIFSSPQADAQELMRKALAESHAAAARAEEYRARLQDMQTQFGDKSAQNKSMEERMRRLEELLEKLLENREKEDEGGPGADAAPLPEELRPAKGLGAGRNPAA